MCLTFLLSMIDLEKAATQAHCSMARGMVKEAASGQLNSMLESGRMT